MYKMVDVISITSLIIAIMASLGHFVKESHLQKCNCFCVNSDCVERNKSKSKLTPPNTPIERNSKDDIEKDDMNKIKKLLEIMDKSDNLDYKHFTDI
jgi:hypothetical protein